MTLVDELLESLAAVGDTGRTSARFWVRAQRPCRLELKIRSEAGEEHGGVFELSAEPETDFTTSAAYPDDFPAGRDLAPGTRHRWAIRRIEDGRFLGEGSFETSPASQESARDEISFAVLSCHMPFDRGGEIRPESLNMLSAAASAFEQHDVKRVLMMGDQVYSDYPKRCSLFDPDWFRTVGPRGRSCIFECTRDEVRRLYHQRYRAFWSMREFQVLMQRWPCYMMFDDHDICENFGTRLEHSSASWRSVREGALDALFDYQGLRQRGRGAGRPSSFHFQLEYGPVAVFVMDLRSQRGWADGRHQVYGEDQHHELERFLEANRERPVILLGMSVPLVHVPEWLPLVAKTMLSEAGDLDDRWSSPISRAQRDRLVRLLSSHQRRCPNQRIVIVAGDIHVGLVNRIHWESSATPPCYQLVSSAVSHLQQPLIQKGASLVSRLKPEVHVGGLSDARIELLSRPRMKNPYDRLNVGLVKVVRKEGDWRVKLMLLGHDRSDPPRAKVVFESEPI